MVHFCIQTFHTTPFVKTVESNVITWMDQISPISSKLQEFDFTWAIPIPQPYKHHHVCVGILPSHTPLAKVSLSFNLCVTVTFSKAETVCLILWLANHLKRLVIHWLSFLSDFLQ